MKLMLPVCLAAIAAIIVVGCSREHEEYLNGQGPPQPSPKGAFTLLELLVTMAIIGVLATLLLAALSAAKREARSAACNGQLRQLGIALRMYVDSDNQHYPPMWGDGHGGLPIWADKLLPYSGLNWTNNSWHCPAYIAEGGLVEVVKQPGGAIFVYISYAYNAYGTADLPFVYGTPGSPSPVAPPLGLGVRRTDSLASEPEVTAPSEMFAIADSRTFRDNPDGLRSDIAMRPYGTFGDETPPLHGKGYNMLFADGHVLLVNRTDYLFPPRSAQNWNRDHQPHPESWAPRNQWPVQQ
jgi:prepilin-type N-terminal cleavage/methylation domain-containing protein/prepilin-type processing-associated H-X9-DG protein